MSFSSWLRSWKSLVTPRKGALRSPQPRPKRNASPLTTRPCLEALEDRSLPSAAHALLADIVRPHAGAAAAAPQQLPFKESLTGVSVSPTGVVNDEGNATAVGHVTAEALAAPTAATHVLPFQVSGGGIGAHGIPIELGVPAPHDATGTATHLGKYSAEGMFQLDSFTSATTGTFSSAQPVVFVAANGDRLAFNYAGTFQLFDAGGGKVYTVFTAEFTPVPQESTGRFTKVTGGSFTMVATTDPFVLGSTDPLPYTWVGEGTIEFAHGRK